MPRYVACGSSLPFRLALLQILPATELSIAGPGALLLHSVGRATVEEGQQMIEEVLCDGSALARFEKMLIHQNVDPQLAAELCSGAQVLPRSKYVTPLVAPSSGESLD